MKQGKQQNLDKTWKENVAQHMNTSNNFFSQTDFKVSLLTNVVIRQEEQIKELESKVDASYQREIRPNLVIFGILDISLIS